MAELTITIPDNKIPIIIEAVEYFISSVPTKEPITGISGATAVAWLKEKHKEEIIRRVKHYQEIIYEESFILDNPMEE